MSVPISVLVVEDHALFRTGIKVSCNRDQDISVTGEASNGSEGLAQAIKLNPDVVLMDVHMPLMDGIESTRLIRNQNQNTKIIMLTSHDSRAVMSSAMSAGASGYCLKDVDSEILCSAIKAVHRGEVWLDSGIDSKCLKSARERLHSLVGDEPLFDETSDSQPARECQSNTVKMNISFEQNQGSGMRQAICANQNGENLLDRYESLGLLGQGGMSHVYKARHRLLNKIVAVKVLASHLNHIEAFSARFIQEARIASRLSHPNIASVFDFGLTVDSNAFLVMEFVDGPSLADILQQAGKLEETKARVIFSQLKDALAYAHTQGVIHRDIKPANTILTETGDGVPLVKLVDFGLAKVTGGENPKLTLNGEVIGSPLYMSPEQCQGLPLDCRSDIYSLGCLMYEAICGYPPYRGETALDTFRLHVEGVYQEPSANLCSEHLREILRKCLSKRPEDRFSSLEQIGELK